MGSWRRLPRHPKYMRYLNSNNAYLVHTAHCIHKQTHTTSYWIKRKMKMYSFHSSVWIARNENQLFGWILLYLLQGLLDMMFPLLLVLIWFMIYHWILPLVFTFLFSLFSAFSLSVLLNIWLFVSFFAFALRENKRDRERFVSSHFINIWKAHSICTYHLCLSCSNDHFIYV